MPCCPSPPAFRTYCVPPSISSPLLHINCPKLSGLNTHLLFHVSWGSGVQTQLSWVLCPGSHEIQRRRWPDCILTWRLDCRRICFRAPLGCCQNPLPTGCVERGPGIWLAGSWQHPGAGGCLHFQATWASSAPLLTS